MNTELLGDGDRGLYFSCPCCRDIASWNLGIPLDIEGNKKKKVRNLVPENLWDRLLSKKCPRTSPQGTENGAHSRWFGPLGSALGCRHRPTPKSKVRKSKAPLVPLQSTSSSFFLIPYCWQEGFSVLFALMFIQNLPPWHHVTLPGTTHRDVWGGRKKNWTKLGLKLV